MQFTKSIILHHFFLKQIKSNLASRHNRSRGKSKTSKKSPAVVVYAYLLLKNRSSQFLLELWKTYLWPRWSSSSSRTCCAFRSFWSSHSISSWLSLEFQTNARTGICSATNAVKFENSFSSFPWIRCINNTDVTGLLIMSDALQGLIKALQKLPSTTTTTNNNNFSSCAYLWIPNAVAFSSTLATYQTICGVRSVKFAWATSCKLHEYE